MKLQILYVLGLLVFFSACNQKGSAAVPPANLQVSAMVNPDESGNVAFVAEAVNAVSYDFDFGNSSFLTVTNGKASVKYASTGTYNVTVVAKSSNGMSITKTIQVNVTIKLTLVWSDEFNTDGVPDLSKWDYDIGTGSNGWGNAELQYYTSRPENVTVQNGVLKIKLIKENYSGSAYTSARLLSKGKFAIKYGTVDVRAKLPAGGGTWPAIWMLGNNINTAGWPACGEIDIMEHKGNDLNRIYGTLHYPGRAGGNADGNTKVISNASTEFHNYKLEWTTAAIKIYADDQLIHTVANSSAIPFNHDFFFLLNVAMGGTFGGAVDPAVSSATMEVDYIRVYK